MRAHSSGIKCLPYVLLIGACLLLPLSGAAAGDALQEALEKHYGLDATEAARLAAAARALGHEADRIDRTTLERVLGDCRSRAVAPDRLPRMLLAWGRYRARLLAVGEAPVAVRREIQAVTRAALVPAGPGDPAARLERMIGNNWRKRVGADEDRETVRKKKKDKEKYDGDGDYSGSRGKKPKPKH